MSLYQVGFFILIGVILGVFIALKWISPPSEDIRIGRLVIKGRKNTIQDGVDITRTDSDQPLFRSRILARRQAKRRLKKQRSADS